MARFSNLDGSGPHPLYDVFRWAVSDRVRGRRRVPRTDNPAPRVETDRSALATPPPPGAGARLTWLGHSSWLVQLDGVSLLIDPLLRDRIPGVPPRFVPPALRPGELPPIAAQLVSHAHYDHCDVPTLRAVGAPVVAGLGLGAYLARRGFAIGGELAWWQSVTAGPVTITFVPAQHWSRRGLFDTNETLWGGFVVEGSSASVYHAGDTARFDGFAEIGRRFPRLDAALLPIGAYDPAWFMERSHLNPEQAVAAFVALGARRMLPMHWGSLVLTDEPLDEPPARVGAEWARRGLPDGDLALLPVGGSFHTF